MIARACPHVLGDHDSYVEVFVGRGIESDLLCAACSASTDRSKVVEICAGCEKRVRDEELSGVLGKPEAIVIASTLRLAYEEIVIASPPLVDLQPLTGSDRNRWIGLSADALFELDLDARTVRRICATDHGTELLVSAGGRFAAVFQPRGTSGAVISLATGEVTLPLVREDYHSEHCDFPIAFIERDGETLVCHARLWNRVDLYEAATGAERTPRVQEPYEREQRLAHYLDYFHCGLVVSPDQRRIADNGWVWHPVGEVVTWSIDAWLANVWESEDGASRKMLLWRTYFWDGPIAWLDDTRLVVWGYGKDDGQLADAVMIYNTVTGAQERWFGGVPAGAMFVDDGRLIVLGEGRLTIWDVERGARMLDVETSVLRFHPDAKLLVSLPSDGVVMVARVCGYHGEVTGVIAELVQIGDPESLPVLGDALEAAGYTDAALLEHCRSPGPHGARCWVFDHLRHE